MTGEKLAQWTLYVTSMKTSVLWLLLGLIILSLHGAQAGCSVSLSSGFPDPAPLILTPGGSRDVLGFKLPSPSRDLNFTRGEKVRLVCTGSGNSFSNLKSSTKDITVTCVSDDNFDHKGVRRKFQAFSCSEVPQSITRRSSDRCNNNKHPILEIGFKVTGNEFFKVIDVCFDDRRLNNVWSRSYVLSAAEIGETDFRMAGVKFTTTSLFPELDPEALYSKETQTINIGRIIGNSQANHYINSTYYLSKGLLSDSNNFVYKSQKYAALNFVNVAPQWGYLRVNLWSVVENRIRSYAHQLEEDLLVYSGTHGVTTLTEVVSRTPTECELYLSIKGNSRKMAVPAIFWKVVYEPISKRGVVLVSINNPHKGWDDLETDSRYKVCKTKRYMSQWYVCTSSSEEYGMGYCCEVDDFRNFVKSLPPFEVTGLL